MRAELSRTPPPGAVASELRIESEAVSVAKAISWFSMVAFAFGLTAIVIGVSPIVAIVALIAFYGYSRSRARAARACPAVIHVTPGEDGELVLERRGKRLRFKMAKIADCWHWPDARGVNVMVATGKTMVSIQVPDRESAAALSAALGLDTSRQLVGTTLTAAPVFTGKRWRQFTSRHLPEMLVVLGIVALFFVVLPELADLSGFAGLITLLAILMLPAIVGVTRDALPSRVLVGRDGLLLSSFGRREFIGYERIKRVRRAPFAATLTLTNDEIVLLPVSPAKNARKRLNMNSMDAWMREPDKVRARRQALVEQIDAALTRFRNGGTAAAAVGRVLERGQRSIEEWRESIARAAAGGYRETHVDADLLLDIVENPRSPVGQRLGAALALTRVPDESSPVSHASRLQRVRAAIASSANPRVRVALAHAADGTLDDATYERAVEAEAVALEESTAPRGLPKRSRI